MSRVFLIILGLSLASPIIARPRPGVDVSPFGSQIPWPSDPILTTYADTLSSAGVEWARSELIWWGLCEQTPGVYNFDVSYSGGQWDAYNWLDQLEARNIEPYAILAYGNDLYGGTPDTPAGRAAYVNYCTALVTEFADRVDVWEIWNEPNLAQFWGKTPNSSHYAALVAAAAPAIRAADPDCIIVGGVTSGIDRSFLTSCFQNGMLQHIDVVSIHPYRINMPESINGEVASLRAEMNTYTNGSNVKIWTGEWGYNAGWTEIDETGQAKMLSRMMVNNLSQDIELSIWFSVHGWDVVEDWGLTRWNDKQTRAAHTAMRVVNQRLPTPVSHIENPFPVQFDPYFSSYRAEVFERGSVDYRTMGLWRARWPQTTGVLVSDIELQMDPSRRLSVYDGLEGAEFRTNAVWDLSGGTVTLENFAMRDYPSFLNIDTEVLPEGRRIPQQEISVFSADSELSPANLAFDGLVSEASKWTSNNTVPPHWLAVELESEYNVTGFALRLPSLAGEMPGFNAEAVSFQSGPAIDGPWSTLASEANPLQHDRMISILPSAERTRHVRLLVTDPGIDDYARIPEFEIYTTDTPGPSATRSVWSIR